MSFTKDINQHLQSKLLPPALYKKYFVTNEPRCNYEDYLREAINSSNFFLELSAGEKYSAPITESHGECDAISERYKLDFKLAEGNSKIEAKSLLEPGITKLANGAAIWHTSKVNGKTTALHLNRMLRKLNSTNDISTILASVAENIKFSKRTEENIEQQGLYEIKILAEKLLTKKNLLFFLPEIFSFVDEISYGYNEAIDIIGKALEYDFSIAFDFRNQENPGFDTYICCIYNEQFLFYSYKDKHLSFIESVKCFQCETYEYLYVQYGEWF